MTKTKIFNGNKYVTSFNCDGRYLTRFQLFKFKVGQFTKRTLIVLAVIASAGWISTGSYWYAKNNVKPVTVWAESIKEVPIGTKFEDIALLVKICKAESGNRQFNSKGDVLRGIVNPSDIGYCQINEPIWNDTARKMGMDIYTEKGNKEFAVWLFLQQGSAPWNSSKDRWNK